jgi:hypothetical protein
MFNCDASKTINLSLYRWKKSTKPVQSKMRQISFGINQSCSNSPRVHIIPQLYIWVTLFTDPKIEPWLVERFLGGVFWMISEEKPSGETVIISLNYSWKHGRVMRRRNRKSKIVWYTVQRRQSLCFFTVYASTTKRIKGWCKKNFFRTADVWGGGWGGKLQKVKRCIVSFSVQKLLIII